jgi:hypothetical protein
LANEPLSSGDAAERHQHGRPQASRAISLVLSRSAMAGGTTGRDQTAQLMRQGAGDFNGR